MKEKIKKLNSNEPVYFGDYLCMRKSVVGLGYSATTAHNRNVLNYFVQLEQLEKFAHKLLEVINEIKNEDKFSAGEEYFFVHPDGSINKCDITFFMSDYLFMAMDNIFKTYEEAEEHKEEILAKFREAKEKYVRS